MKKCLILLSLSLTCAGVVSAAQISESQAAEIARKYLPQSSSKQLSPVKVKSAVGVDAPYYAFNAGGEKGFVIVSGDDSLTPIVGYSDSGYFSDENMPENLKNYLEQYEKYVAAVQSGEVKASYAAVSTGEPVVESFVASRWNQDEPFNNYCPEDPYYAPDKAPIGCLATAMAQVMNYWEWPKQGKGSNVYQLNSYMGIAGQYSSNFSESVYDWDNMLDNYVSTLNENGTYTNDYTEAEGDAVAQLMYDCAVSVNMMFNSARTGGSGALESDALIAAAKYFGYDSEIHYRNSYWGSQFFEQIKKEMDERHPVLFCGAGDAGGHAFVIDGYDSNRFLHVNWGWGGVSDGYYNMDLMNPSSLGIGGGSGGFTEGQSIIVFHKNENGDEARGQLPLSLMDVENYDITGEVKAETAGPITKGDSFKISMSGIYNGFYYNRWSGSVSVGVYSQDGELLTDPSGDASSQNIPAGQMVFNPVRFDMADQLQDLADGEYYICGVSKEDGYSDWVRLDASSRIRIQVNGDEISQSESSKILSIETPIVADRSAVEVGDRISFTVTVRNQSDEVAKGRLSFEVRNQETDVRKASLTADVVCSDNSESVSVASLNINGSAFKDGEHYYIVITGFTSSTDTNFNLEIGDFERCEFVIGAENAGIGAVQGAGSVDVYPNPVADVLNVKSAVGIDKIEVYSTEGRLVKSATGTAQLNVADLTSGYYVAIVTDENGTVVRKPIIKK